MVRKRSPVQSRSTAPNLKFFKMVRNKNSLKIKSEGKGKIKKVKKRNKREDSVTDHHIIPLSRNGLDIKKNKASVIIFFHKRYHELFGNMIPGEILAFLETYFWKNQKRWINEYSFYRHKNLLDEYSFKDRKSFLKSKKTKNSRRINRRENSVTNHYIIPLSRNGFDIEENKTYITVYFHERYQRLFGDMIPNEILTFLETYFWKNQKNWIDEYSFSYRQDNVS